MSGKYERLDKEHAGRIREIGSVYASGKEISVSDVFPAKPVAQSLDKTKIILESFDVRRILTALPFTTEIYVTLCPYCSCREDQRQLTALLEQRAITPILIAPYAAYPEPVADAVIKYPHMSLHEFSFFRWMQLTHDAKGIVCQHCITERNREYNDLAAKSDMPGEARDAVDSVFHALYPFINPDYELLEHFGDALKAKDPDRLLHINAVAGAVWDARTTQAFGARTTLPAQHVPRLISEAQNAMKIDPAADLELLDGALMQDVHLEIPADVNVSQYVSVVQPYRAELASIADSIIDDTNTNALTTMNARLATLNDELARIRRSKGLLLYRAATGFVRANKTILASGLMASVMGLSGNFLGCGASILAGTGAQIAKKMGKLKLPEEGEALVEEIKHSLRPYIHKLLSKYLNIDIRAVQLWDINEKINRALLKQDAPTTGSTRIARPRRARKR